jgi:2-polyprenyl-3-methyl-5-hydroxy-6-metoxy-1,4-benzoquinol methylase
MQPGFMLDVGCGIGRNLAHLDGSAVGVDHNQDSVAVARDRGLRAFTPDEFLASEYARPGTFDSLLSAHVVEHMSSSDATALLGAYLPYVKVGGRLILITPQESGYRSDATHREFVDFAAQERLAHDLGLTVLSRRSFPFPRMAGRWFRYNEFVLVARKG